MRKDIQILHTRYGSSQTRLSTLNLDEPGWTWFNLIQSRLFLEIPSTRSGMATTTTPFLEKSKLAAKICSNNCMSRKSSLVLLSALKHSNVMARETSGQTQQKFDKTGPRSRQTVSCVPRPDHWIAAQRITLTKATLWSFLIVYIMVSFRHILPMWWAPGPIPTSASTAFMPAPWHDVQIQLHASCELIWEQYGGRNSTCHPNPPSALGMSKYVRIHDDTCHDHGFTVLSMSASRVLRVIIKAWWDCQCKSHLEVWQIRLQRILLPGRPKQIAKSSICQLQIIEPANQCLHGQHAQWPSTAWNL